jgi:hypothetical protein
MSEDASYELQQAIVRRLKADDAVNALIGGRVYDRIPAKDDKVTAEFPFVSLGPEQDLPDHIDCIEGGDIVLQIDVWSRDVGRKQAKRIARAVKDALDDADLELGGSALVCLSYEGRHVLPDPDGLTTHIAMSFQATVEEH